MADYISREPMIEEMRKLIDSVAVNFPNATETELIILKGKYEAFIEYIQKQPAADVQPVKHGRWIWVKDYRDCEGDIYSQYKCSCCDFCVGGVYSVKDLTHFCGNCGARMDGDTNG